MDTGDAFQGEDYLNELQLNAEKGWQDQYATEISRLSIPRHKRDDVRNYIKSEVARLKWERSTTSAMNILNKCFGVSGHERAKILLSPIRRPSQDIWSIDDEFWKAYNALIHSPALGTMLKLEQHYALAIMNMIDQRDSELKLLRDQHEGRMSRLVSVGMTYSEDEVNRISQAYFEQTQLLEVRWASELSDLNARQKREYKDFVVGLSDKPDDIAALASEDTLATNSVGEHVSHLVRQEESFTINLGMQLKTMHNVRIMIDDILSLCRPLLPQKHLNSGIDPNRLQNVLSLYTDNLSSMVMVVDDRISSLSGIKKEFSRICEQSTEFHFHALDQQLAHIRDGISNNSDSETPMRDVSCKPGDIYMTRHSNLAHVQVVFHLVSDDTVFPPSVITSRHHSILSLRSIIRLCFQHDIRNITIPLFLMHTFNDEMTHVWCIKRAELVLKCVKGFLIEMGTWAGTETRTIQFQLPLGTDGATFEAISTLLPTIFRLSNPFFEKDLRRVGPKIGL